MLTLLILSLLAGLVLGQRFKVLILVPAALPPVVLAAVIGLVQADAFLTVALSALAAIGCLQIGYLAGTVVHRGLGSARPRQLRIG
jgi:hypothetical protein